MVSFSSVISAASDAVLLLKQVIVLSLVNSAYNGAENNFLFSILLSTIFCRIIKKYLYKAFLFLIKEKKGFVFYTPVKIRSYPTLKL